MRKLLLTLLLLLPLCVAAQNEPNTMLVRMKNGTTVSYAFADMPKVTIEGTNLVITAHMYAAQHPLSDVQRYEFKYDPSGISTPALESNVRQEGDIIIVSGAKADESLSVYNAAGALVASAQADADGRATVSLATLPTGVYLLNINGCSTKILKR